MQMKDIKRILTVTLLCLNYRKYMANEKKLQKTQSEES